MSDRNLRSKLIRLAHENPELRQDILPLLGDKVGSTDTWFRQLNDLKNKFLSEVVDEALRLLRNEGVNAGGRASGVVAAVSGTTSGGEKISVRWQWSRRGDISTMETEMVLGSKKRSGQIQIGSSSAMQVASEAIYAHFQGLLP